MFVTDYKRFLTAIAKAHLQQLLDYFETFYGVSMSVYQLFEVDIRHMDDTTYATLYLNYAKLVELIDIINQNGVQITDDMYVSAIEDMQQNITKDILRATKYTLDFDQIGDNIQIFRTSKNLVGLTYKTNINHILVSDTDNSFRVAIVTADE